MVDLKCVFLNCLLAVVFAVAAARVAAGVAFPPGIASPGVVVPLGVAVALGVVPVRGDLAGPVESSYCLNEAVSARASWPALFAVAGDFAIVADGTGTAHGDICTVENGTTAVFDGVDAVLHGIAAAVVVSAAVAHQWFDCTIDHMQPASLDRQGYCTQRTVSESYKWHRGSLGSYPGADLSKA